MIHQIGRKICDTHHLFAAIQETDCVDFFTLWEGVCTYIFSISDYVCISEFYGINKNSDNSPIIIQMESCEIPSIIILCEIYFSIHTNTIIGKS